MGGTESKLNIDTSILNKTTMDIINRNQQTASQASASVQTMNVNNVTAFCELGILQNMDIQVTSLQSITAKMSADLVSAIMNSLDQQTKDQFQETNGWGAIPENKEIIDNTKTSITNELKVKLSTDNLNAIVQRLNTVQDLRASNVVIDPCGRSMLPYVTAGTAEVIAKNCNPTPSCKISQDLNVQLMAQQITESVMALISKNEAATTLVNKFDKETKVTNTGIFQDIFKGISDIFGQWTWMIIAIAALCPIIIIALAYFASSPGGQKIINKGGNLAAAKYGGGKF